jgi:hypothetical protein
MHQMSKETEQTLLELERSFWAGDLDVYADNVDDQCMLLFSTWEGVYSSETFVEGFDTDVWTKAEITKEDVLQPLPDLAMIKYSVNATGPKGRSYQGTAISSYVNRDGVWKLVSHQRTPLE